MTYQKFRDLCISAQDCSSLELFIVELGATDGLFDCSDEQIPVILEKIYALKDRTIKSLLNVAGLSQAKFSRDYFISIRTIEDWVAEKAKQSEYNFYMMAYAVFSDAEII